MRRGIQIIVVLFLLGLWGVGCGGICIVRVNDIL